MYDYLIFISMVMSFSQIASPNVLQKQGEIGMEISSVHENKKTITIDNRYLFTPRIEKEEEMPSSLFSSLYLDAAGSLQEICETSSEKENLVNSVRPEDSECNPVISFVGGRGSGKTSAMLSFLDAITHNKGEFLENTFKKIKTYDFFPLPVIDPTALSKNEALLSVIAAHMYKKIEKIQKSILCGKGKELQSRIEAFAPELRKLYDSLRLLFQERSMMFEEFGGLERLSALSVSYNLREQFKKTVNSFLELMAYSYGKDGKKHNSLLVIAIDDLDMNAQMGYQICEEIRKYLTIPHVVVLFSVKMAQLQDVVQMTFLREFEDVKGHFSLSDSFAGMAEKYLTKLFPISRRHVMPSFALYNMAEYSIIEKKISNSDDQPQTMLVGVLLAFLYRKLGLILIPNQYNSHDLLPKSLRGTVHLYNLLSSMKDIFKTSDPAPLKFEEMEKDARGTLSHNIEIFWNSYLADYAEDSGMEAAPKGTIAFLRRLKAEPWQNKNRFVTREIRKIMEDQKLFDDMTPINAASISDICSVQTLSANVSLGDVLYMLDTLRKLSDKPYIGPLVTYIQTTYSLELIRMFFCEKAPDKMRRFIVQLNNPDSQRLVREERSSSKIRDWRVFEDINTISFNESLEISETKYGTTARDHVASNLITVDMTMNETLRDYLSNLDINQSNIFSSPLGWVLLNYVWCGNPYKESPDVARARVIPRSSGDKVIINWRRVFDEEPYLDSLNLLKNSNTHYISFNYSQYLVNSLDIGSIFIRAGLTKRIANIKYIMHFPLYSSELINACIMASKNMSEKNNEAMKYPGKYFEMYSEFLSGVDEFISDVNIKLTHQFGGPLEGRNSNSAFINPIKFDTNLFKYIYQIPTIARNTSKKENDDVVSFQLDRNYLKYEVRSVTVLDTALKTLKKIQDMPRYGNITDRLHDIIEKNKGRGQKKPEGGTKAELQDILDELIKDFTENTNG